MYSCSRFYRKIRYNQIWYCEIYSLRLLLLQLNEQNMFTPDGTYVCFTRLVYSALNGILRIIVFYYTVLEPGISFTI